MVVDNIGCSNILFGMVSLSLILFFHGNIITFIFVIECKIIVSRFLWIMGVSLVVSLRNRLRHAVPRRQLVFHVLQRSFVLILFGIILNSHGNPATLNKLRFPGVLQRIGVTYLIVGLLETVFTKRTETVSEVCLKIITP